MDEQIQIQRVKLPDVTQLINERTRMETHIICLRNQAVSPGVDRLVSSYVFCA